jgi:tetratricopeptide (TPR) repeat protein
MYRHYLEVSPDHKGVRLEYADFLSAVLGRYGDAVDLIEEGRGESVNLYDKDLLLALGDVYLRWGEDDPRQFEKARFQYAKALEIHGALEEVTLRMLRYFLTIRDEEEVDRLLGLFSAEKPGKTRVPRLAAEVYSKVGDYYLDRGLLLEARRFVDLALAADPLSPSPWFTDARYQRMMGEPNDELNAYRQVLVNLEGSESYSNDDLRMRILTHANIGRLRSEEAGDRDTQRRARKAYLEAVELYDDAVARNLLGSSPEYAEIFVGLGDLYYRGIERTHDLRFSLDHHPEAFSLTGDTDMESALRYYDRAAEIYGPDRVPTETRYRRGYARYVLEKDGDYEEVLRDFHRVARDLPANQDVRYSLASVLMKRGDYEAARSQYVKTLELLEDNLRFSGGVLDPVNSPGHQDLLIRFVGTWNNLGVARARSAARTGDEESFAAALAAFARASEYLDRSVGDSALRDAENEDRRIIEPAEGRRTLKEKTTIPYLNRQYLLFPSDDITYPSGGEVFTMDDFIPYEGIPGYVSVL